MSVIAYDGKTIAADRQGTSYGMRMTVEKLIQLDTGEVLGCVGENEHSTVLFDWYKNGADPKAWPEFQKGEDGSVLIVARHDGVVFYDKQPVAQKMVEPFHAWGCGRDYAMGAMACGASALKAVQITCEFDVYCGCGVTVFGVAKEQNQPGFAGIVDSGVIGNLIRGAKS